MIVKEKTFTIGAKLSIEVTTSIRAKDYEDAIVQARNLRANDFVIVPPSNCWIDGDIDKITFISEDELLS